MAVVHFAAALKDQVLAPVVAAIDAGTGAGTIKIYTGAIPANCSIAVTTQTLLGTLTFSDPCGTISSGTITMSAITQDSAADATGTAAWARVADSTGTTVMDLDITSTGGGGSLTLNTTNIVVGGPILITSFTIAVA